MAARQEHTQADSESGCCGSEAHDHGHGHDHAQNHEHELSDESAFALEVVAAFDDTEHTLARMTELLTRAPVAWIDYCDADGLTALFLAVYAQRPELVHLLLAAGASPHASAESLMVLACMRGSLEIVRALHSHGAQVTGEYVGPRVSPLYAACKMGHVDVVQWLVHSGADLDDADEDGATPFMVAAGQARLQIVRLLAAAGANVHCATPSGLSSAYYAALSGHVALLQFFLDERIALCDADGEPSNLLDAAVRGDQLRVAALLLEHTRVLDDHVDECLTLAVRRCHAAMVALLIRFDADIEALDEDGVSPLYAAAQCGDADVVRTLLDAGADLARVSQSTGYTPVHEMARCGHAELLALAQTLRPATDFAAASRFDALMPLHLAAANDHEDAVRFLVRILEQQQQSERPETPADDIDARGPRAQTPLILAAENGCLDSVRVLLAAGASVNARTGSGLTALIGAAYVGALSVIELLCEHGADVDIATHAGVTALHAAAQYGHIAVVEYLLEDRRARADLTWTGMACVLAGAVMNGHLEVVFTLAAHGAELDYAGGAHLSPLFLAAQYNELAMVRLLLLASGVTVDAANEQPEDVFAAGSTALMVAAQRGHVEIVKCLCAHSADQQLRNRDGQSALDLARLAQRHDVVGLLVIEAGAAH